MTKQSEIRLIVLITLAFACAFGIALMIALTAVTP
jgi:hypothetical protein